MLQRIESFNHLDRKRKGGCKMEERLLQLKDKVEADQSLGEKLFALETPEEVQSFLQAEGLEFTIDEIMTLREALVKALEKKENGELSDEDLEEVAGGLLGLRVLGILMLIGLAIGTDRSTNGNW
jgi:predicted ribosomally synthesized peptide with nif11-like leader